MVAKATKMQNDNVKFKMAVILGLIFFFTFSPVFSLAARTFDPHDILNDNELFDATALSPLAIQKFLDRENSALANFSQNVNGQSKTAAAIMAEIAKLHQISPKFLLAVLEKEKGLISKSQAAQKELDWATGYSCHSGRCNEKYRGFYNQTESTAITQEIYRQKASQFSFQVGKTTKTFDGFFVTPKNQATANLYIYTPYLGNVPELGISSKFGGNYLFWKIWNRYFTEKKYPNGLILTDGKDYWLVAKEQKRKFASRETFLKDYRESDAIFVTAKTLAAYDDSQPIYFADNTLVKSDLTGQAFLILDHQKRPILDETALATLTDFHLALNSLAEIPTVANDQLTPYPLGSPITVRSILPQGKLFQTETGQIYLVQDNLKHLVAPAVWQTNWQAQTPETTASAALAQYPTGEPVKFKNGAFVKNTAGNYYLISDGEKLKIENTEILIKVFGEPKFQTAILAPDEVLNLHANGLNIDYADDTITDTIVAPTTLPANSPAAYSASFSSLKPESLTMLTGEIKNLEIKFKNTGSAAWSKGEIWLQIESSDQKINFSEPSVVSGQTATFNFNYQAPVNLGLNQQNFNLYATQNGQPEKISGFGKFVLVKAGTTSEIISQNLPVAVKNNWRPVTVVVKIKNTSPDTVWLANKTALEIYNADGSPSSFYDPDDWVRKAVAAVPQNKTKIKPGEVGEFKFTLKVKNLKPGAYALKFSLKLLDKDKEVLLNGQESWGKKIRVD